MQIFHVCPDGRVGGRPFDKLAVAKLSARAVTRRNTGFPTFAHRTANPLLFGNEDRLQALRFRTKR
jgi:hypothetical protein